MELHVEKLKAVRKRKKITAQELAQKTGISRVTLGAWENSKRIPSEAKIRMLAKVLDISVDEISDLPPDKMISGISLAPLDSNIGSVFSRDKEKAINRQTNLISGITGIIKELAYAKLIIGAMLSSLPAIFYVKGTDLKYITANEAFLRNLSLNKNYDVIGKTDFDFFPRNEAVINSEADKAVLADGKSILDKEGYIPGNRKTRWGIISKIPIYDFEGKIEGVLGYFRDITERKKIEAELEKHQLELENKNEELHKTRAELDAAHKLVEESLYEHQTELEMQNEELRRAHMELDVVRERYFCFYDLAPSGFCTLSEKGLILEANITAANLLGAPQGKLVKQSITRFIFPEDQDIYYLKRKEFLTTGKQQVWEMRMLGADGASFLASLQAAPMPNGESIIVFNDISGCKKLG